MRQTGTERAWDAAALGVIVLMAVGLFVRLAVFPGLHGDEAWIGLFADRLAAQGLFTPHEMNTYTGPLFGELVRASFSFFGPGVWSLRLPGAALNVGAWLLFWGTVRRTGGPAAGAVWALFAAGSGIVFLKSRLAWDVYALQPLMLAATLRAAVWSLEGGGRPAALLLFASSLVGVQNHFIFMSAPLSLAAAAAALYARTGRREWLGLLQTALVNLLPCALLFLMKPLLTEAAWPALRWPLVAAFWAAPVAALALEGRRERWRAPLAAAFSAAAARNAGSWVRKAFVVLLAGFLWFHWVALIEIQSGSAVLQRLASWKLPLWAEVPMFVWAALILVQAALVGLRALEDGGEGLAPPQVLLSVLPVVYAAVFIVFRNTSSVRYYAIISHLVLLAAASRWPWPQARGGAAAAVLAGALAGHGLGWAALLAPGDRPPAIFRVGWHREKSFDFLDKTEFFSEVEAAGACAVDYNENQLDVLLHFDRLARPRPCVSGRRARAFYRWAGPAPYIGAEFSDPR